MTLSLQNTQASWDRTLPKPPALLPHTIHETYPRRSSSLLQHHIVGNKFLSVHADHPEGNARRNTVPCISVTKSLHSTGDKAVTSYVDECVDSRRKRPSSIMSVEDTSISSSPTSTGPLEGSGHFCLCQPEPKIPRPRNAFILYRQHHHAAVVAQHPGLPNPDISKIIGEQWRQLPEKAREEWKALAEEEKVRHSQQYPDYRYKPKRSGRYSGQISVSGPSGTSSSSSEATNSCQKCGGKIMNAPATPYTPMTPAAPPMPSQIVNSQYAQMRANALTEQQNARIPVTQHMVSPPHSARMRQYPEMYHRAVPHDPRFHYTAAQPRPNQAAEGPEPKKRRINGDNLYATGQNVYMDPAYQPQSHRERTASNAMQPAPYHRPNVTMPPRSGFPAQTQQVRQTQSQHRRDPSLTLPPLKTPLGQQITSTTSAQPQSQRSGVEAMIMSIPVLNKIKILSQISPFLAAPGPASPPRETRGAVIAVEGMDSTSVYNMTQSLAEQLEKEGKFAVRIFGGPDPYAMLEASNRASQGDGEHMNVAGFLNVIGEWHKISKEMQEYITTKPRPDSETDEDEVMQGTDEVEPRRIADSKTVDYNTYSNRSPVSAVSPKTISQTADLSLKSPPPNRTMNHSCDKSESPQPSQTPQARPRIPASAIADAKAKAKAEAEAEAAEARKRSQSQSQSDSTTPRANTSPTSQDKTSPLSPTSTATTTTATTSGTLYTRRSTATSNTQTTTSTNAIPIAIVPHYQLTTVDSSSIAMPINDAYSPHSHWQWLATLWRGCIGADATIVIQTGPNENDDLDQQPTTVASNFNTNPNNHDTTTANSSLHLPPFQVNQLPGISTSSSSTTTTTGQRQQDVQVRLLDCRAVVVRADSAMVKGNRDWCNGEWWEKVKRRVGFEVEEFLRR